MPEESNTITIARPVGDVFAFLADAENDKKWRPGVVEIARTGGQGVGTTPRPGRQRARGTKGRCRYRDHRVLARRAHRLSDHQGPVRPTGSYDLRASEGGTELTFRLAAELGGLKMLMSPVVSRTMKSEVGALGELKRVLEDR